MGSDNLSKIIKVLTWFQAKQYKIVRFSGFHLLPCSHGLNAKKTVPDIEFCSAAFGDSLKVFLNASEVAF